MVTLEGELVEIGRALAPADQERLVFFAELIGYACERQYKTGWAAHKYREKFGDWPPRGWIPPAAQPSVETRRWIKSQVIRWMKSRDEERV